MLYPTTNSSRLSAVTMSNNNTLLSEEIETDILPSILNGPPFITRPSSEKIEILRRGRPIPALSIVKKDSTRGCNTAFKTSWYDIHKWLCASSSFNKLFCWPCVLMRPETSSWCSTGNDDMKMFTSLATKHAVSKAHLKAILEYDDTLLELGLPSEFISKKSHNEFSSNYSDTGTFTLQFDSNMDNCSAVSSSATSGVQGMTEITNEASADDKVPKLKTKITLKTMQILNKDSDSKSKCSEEQKMLKWKRRMAKQELINAQLAGEKLQIEIEILKAKADYYKSVNSREVN